MILMMVSVNQGGVVLAGVVPVGGGQNEADQNGAKAVTVNLMAAINLVIIVIIKVGLKKAGIQPSQNQLILIFNSPMS